MTDPQAAAANVGAGLVATNDAMQGIIDSASKGQFQVTPEAGDELIKIFQTVSDWAGLDARGDLDQIKMATPLGPSPAGQAIAEFNQQVAAGGDGRSYEEMIKQLVERAPQVVDAIKKGIQRYQETDEGNAKFGVQA
jgi:hypothetical protein